MQFNVYEAKAKLSTLLDQAQAGEEVVIARAGKPIARLTPIVRTRTPRNGVRFGGLTTKQLKLSRDFHAPLRDEDLLGA